MKHYFIEESPVSYFFLANTKSAWLWLIVRVYLGWTWLEAGWGKFHNPAWWGDHAGGALTGFINGALAKTGGEHPDVQAWYASFLHDAVLPNVYLWSHMVVLGEMLVGIALIAGFLVGISAFIGTFMSFNFLLAGTVSINPFLVAFGILLVLAWRVSGYIGLDYYVLPMFHRYLRPKRVLWS